MNKIKSCCTKHRHYSNAINIFLTINMLIFHKKKKDSNVKLLQVDIQLYVLRYTKILF